jgi:flavin reductase (DIM6/NTAB) family NADH-FMN oxidoreductase RutF
MRSLPAFPEGWHFVVNTLAHDQIELSNKFARTHEKKFAEIDHMIPGCGAPVLIGAAHISSAATECRHYGGDNIIFIGDSRALRLYRQADIAALPRQIHARRAADPTLTRHGIVAVRFRCPSR